MQRVAFRTRRFKEKTQALSTRRNKRPLRWSCGTIRGPLLLQQPVSDFRVTVGFRPRIVAGAWIESEFDVPSAVIFQGLDHALRSIGGNDVVLGAMEDPDGQVLQLVSVVGSAAPSGR